MRLCGAVPVLDFLSSLTLGVAVARLDLSFELGAASADGGQIVIGKPAPFLLGLAPQLLPVSFKSIPIHVNLLALPRLGLGELGRTNKVLHSWTWRTEE